MNDAEWAKALDNPIYPISVSSMIADLTVHAGRFWVKNGWIGFTEKDRRALVAGATTHLTGRRVLEMAIGAQIAAWDIKPSFACAVARHFCDGPSSTHTPGWLLKGGTALIFYRGDPDMARVVEMRPDKPAAQPTLEDALNLPGYGRQRMACFLAVDPIVKHVQIELAKYGAAI